MESLSPQVPGSPSTTAPADELAVTYAIRPAEAADAGMIFGLLAELGYPDNDVEGVRRRIGAWTEEADSAVLVAERSGRLMGLVAVTTIRYLEREGRLGSQ